jgi:hypothetical protein
VTFSSATTFGRARMRVAPSTINLGDVFGKALAVFSGRFVAYCGAFFIGILLIAIVAVIAFFAVMRSASGFGADAAALLSSGGFLITIVMSFLAAIAAITTAHAAICAMAFGDATNRGASLGGAFAYAVARSPALVGLVIVYALCVMLGFAALVIPGLLLLTLFAVALPACIIEGLGPIESLKRSVALTKGDRWRVLGFLLVIHVGVGLGVQLVVHLVRMASTPGLSGLVMFPLELIVGAFGPVALTVLYVQLRAAREGVDVEHIASVFD